MKKFSFIILSALATGLITTITHATDVYLENSYGAVLKYILAEPSTSPSEHVLAINSRSNSLGEIDNINYLAIRTTGVGSGYGLSPYYDLSAYLQQIKAEETEHTDSNAIINVSSSYGRWNITIFWEKESSPLLSSEIDVTLTEVTKEEAAIMSLQSATARLTAIKNGGLGSEYARKVDAICSADYTAAKNKGFIDLCERLQKELMAPQYIKDTRFKKRLPDLKPAIDEIKSSINRLYNSLNNYRTKGIIS
jgi:hypothetical protein